MGRYARMERVVAIIMEIVTKLGTLRSHRKSLKGAVEDFMFTTCKEEVDVSIVIDAAYQAFEKLMEKYDDKIVKVRLVAKVDFEHILSSECRSYYIGSFPSEVVEDSRDLFERHMLKISERLDDFNEHGSNLVIKKICCIFIQLSCKAKTKD